MRISPFIALIILYSVLTAQEKLPLLQVSEEAAPSAFNFQLTPQLPPNITIENDGGITFLNQLGLIRYEGNVSVTAQNGLALYSDHLEVNTKTKNLFLRGDVSIFQNGSLLRGTVASYNYESEKLDTSTLRVGLDPILFQADNLTSEIGENGENYYQGNNAGVTTHDFQAPNYWLRAKEIQVYPGNRVTFRHLKVYAGETPVFWLPYLSQPLDSDLGYHFSPGAKSYWGLFLLNSYGIMLGGNDTETEPWLLSTWHLDFRSQRGVGFGVDLFDTRSRSRTNISGFESYYTYDLNPLKSRTGIARDDISPHRYKFEMKHRHWLDQGSAQTLRFESNLSLLSDQHYLEDYEQRDYKVNPEPDNTLSLFRQTERSLAGIRARIPLNRFYQTDTRLPELFWEFPRQAIADTSWLYESFSSAGLFEERLGDLRRDSLRTEALTLTSGSDRYSEIENLLDQTQFGRLHTYHELSHPLQVFRGINLTPRAGIGHSQYWATGGSHRNSSDRTHLFAGIDSSLKFSKNYNNWNIEQWGLDEALHVIRPYANFSFVATDRFDSSFDRVDRLTPTTRPRAIHIGRFSAIDDIQDWSILRIGLQNSLLTKRNGRAHTWLTIDAHVDAFIEDPEFDRNFSNLYSSVFWDPLPWFQFHSEIQVPISSDSSAFTEFAGYLNFMPHEDWEMTASYRQINSHPSLPDAAHLGVKTYGRLSETWGLGFYQQWSLEDSTLELQEYSVHRDLGSWNISFGGFIRDNRIRDEYGLLLNFSLAEFPSLKVPLSFD